MIKSSFGSCPRCGFDKVLRSRRRGLIERFIKLFVPDTHFYRCHRCGARFRRRASGQPRNRPK